MKIGHPREHRLAACAKPMRPERFVRDRNHLRMIGKAEIIVGTELNHWARLAAVSDRRARVCRGEKLRLIQLDGPRTHAYPICKTRWSLQRFVAFARKKIAQTKFCRILVHHAVGSLPAAPISASGAFQQN